MRIITVRAPAGHGDAVIDLAFANGIAEVSLHHAEVKRPQQTPAQQDVIDIETSTPHAKHFIEALMVAPFFDPTEYALAIRHPRSLIGQEPPKRETYPVVMPTLDVFEELWKYSHITWSLVGRVLMAALLLTYGMIELNLLVMIAGLLFLPYHHPLLAVAFGLWTQQWRLAGRALLALAVITGLIVLAGAVTALFLEPPIRYEEFGTLKSAFAIAVIVGIAAALGMADDAGRIELLGLAATAHTTILPVWFGASLIYGFPEAAVTRERLISFALSVITIILAALLTFAVLKMRGDGLKPLAKLDPS
jgi:hypothetical protein